VDRQDSRPRNIAQGGWGLQALSVLSPRIRGLCLDGRPGDLANLKASCRNVVMPQLWLLIRQRRSWGALSVRRFQSPELGEGQSFRWFIRAPFAA
jgi:hypothetical protein